MKTFNPEIDQINGIHLWDGMADSEHKDHSAHLGILVEGQKIWEVNFTAPNSKGNPAKYKAFFTHSKDGKRVVPCMMHTGPRGQHSAHQYAQVVTSKFGDGKVRVQWVHLVNDQADWDFLKESLLVPAGAAYSTQPQRDWMEKSSWQQLDAIFTAYVESKPAKTRSGGSAKREKVEKIAKTEDIYSDLL